MLRRSGKRLVVGAVVLALAIGAAVVGLARRAHHPARNGVAEVRVPRTSSAGLPGGFVKVLAVDFSSPERGTISFEDERNLWRASTRDAGSHWKTTRAPRYALTSPGLFSGDDGVAVGQSSRGISTYVTRDGGVSWTSTPGARLPNAVSAPSITEATIWTIGGPRCRHCTERILHGRAAADRPTPTAGQPRGLPWIVTAASADVAYAAMVRRGNLNRLRLFVTRDAGHSWGSLAPQSCDANVFHATHDGSLWLQCLGTGGSSTVRMSDDGGRHWRPLTRQGAQLAQIAPVSRTVAWGIDDRHELMRTTDGGRTWKPMIKALRATSIPALDAIDATRAMLAMPYPGRGDRGQILVAGIGPGGRSSFVTLPRSPP